MPVGNTFNAKCRADVFISYVHKSKDFDAFGVLLSDLTNDQIAQLLGWVRAEARLEIFIEQIDEAKT